LDIIKTEFQLQFKTLRDHVAEEIAGEGCRAKECEEEVQARQLIFQR
jgi:hypothetical protein